MASKKEAFDHALSALDLLTHHQINLSLMLKIRDELRFVVRKLIDTLSTADTPSKNEAKEVLFYQNLLQSLEQGIQNRDLSSVRWVEKSLKHHLLKKAPNNQLLHHLLSVKQDWIPDTIAEN